jgi:hypothetical protein
MIYINTNTPPETTTYTLEELTNVSKLITLEGTTTEEHEQIEDKFLLKKHLYINSKYKFGYGINTKDIHIINNVIHIDKNDIFLDYIETLETNIYFDKDFFVKDYTHPELENIKQEMKNKVRIKLYDQSYYDKAYTNLLNYINEEEVLQYANLQSGSR